MKKNYIKEIYKDIKLYYRVDINIRDFFSEYLNKGNIIELISFEKNKYYTCSPGMPSEYFSRENITTSAEVLTDKNEKYVINENFFGINFESPCDKYNIKIYDNEGNMIANTNDYLLYINEKKNNTKNMKLNK